MMRRMSVLARDERIDGGEVRAMLGGVAPPRPVGDAGIEAAIHARIARLPDREHERDCEL